MTPLISIIAYTFYAAGVALAVPGMAYILYDWTCRLRRKLFPKPEPVPMSLQNPDGLLLLLQGLSRGVFAAGKIGGFVGELVAGILAGIAISAVLLGTLLFFTARGLLREDEWARWVAGLLLLNLLLFSLLSVATSGKRRPRRFAVSLLIAVVSGVAVHALWRGYGP